MEAYMRAPFTNGCPKCRYFSNQERYCLHFHYCMDNCALSKGSHLMPTLGLVGVGRCTELCVFHFFWMGIFMDF